MILHATSVVFCFVQGVGIGGFHTWMMCRSFVKKEILGNSATGIWKDIRKSNKYVSFVQDYRGNLLWLDILHKREAAANGKCQ